MDRLPPMLEAHGVADGKRPLIPATHHSMYPPNLVAPVAHRPGTDPRLDKRRVKICTETTLHGARQRQNRAKLRNNQPAAAVYIEASTLPSVTAIFAAFASCL